jgi:hypothetical protein
MARNQQTTKDTDVDDGAAAIGSSDAVDLVLEDPILGTDDGPIDDPTNLGSTGGSPGLPDLGIGEDAPIGDLDDPGAELGSSLLDDLTRGTDVPDPTEGLDGLDAGWSPPVIDDQSGWAMSGDPDDTSDATDSPPGLDDFLDSMEAAAFGDGERAVLHLIDGANELTAAWTAASEAEVPVEALEALQSGGPPDPNPPEQAQASAPESDTTPIPEEADAGGGRGDLDPAVTGNVDPDPELEPAGGRGALIDTGGDVDPDPALDDAGEATTLDVERAGFGAVDPLDEGASLLDGGGDLAEMTAAADLGGDIGIDLDDSLVDMDPGQDA